MGSSSIFGIASLIDIVNAFEGSCYPFLFKFGLAFVYYLLIPRGDFDGLFRCIS